jgi:hypothetical protein
MADVFRLHGEFSAAPAVFELGVGQGPEQLGAIDHDAYVVRRTSQQILLSGDAPVSIPLGSLTGAHVILIQTTGRVRVRLTSADGSQQAVPADPLLILLTPLAAPVTALDLTRTAGVTTEATVFLGEKAT